MIATPAKRHRCYCRGAVARRGRRHQFQATADDFIAAERSYLAKNEFNFQFQFQFQFALSLTCQLSVRDIDM
jgi:hypothetical protein